MSHYIWDVNPENVGEIETFVSNRVGCAVEIDIRYHAYKTMNGYNDDHKEVDHLVVKYDVGYDEDQVWLKDMPGQCGVLIAYYLHNRQIEVEIVELLARLLLYRTVVVTRVYGHPDINAYIEADYETVWTSVNSHSGNDVEIRMKCVGDPDRGEREFIERIWPNDEYDNDYALDEEEYYDFYDNW